MRSRRPPQLSPVSRQCFRWGSWLTAFKALLAFDTWLALALPAASDVPRLLAVAGGWFRLRQATGKRAPKAFEPQVVRHSVGVRGRMSLALGKDPWAYGPFRPRASGRRPGLPGQLDRVRLEWRSLWWLRTAHPAPRMATGSRHAPFAPDLKPNPSHLEQTERHHQPLRRGERRILAQGTSARASDVQGELAWPHRVLREL